MGSAHDPSDEGKTAAEVAANLAAGGTTVLGAAARTLFEDGGRRVRYEGGSTSPLPLIAAEVAALAADDAALAARRMPDAASAAELWRLDKRVSVRTALSKNPRIDARLAVHALTWAVQRTDPVDVELAVRAGRGGARAVFDENPDATPTLFGEWSDWALLLGADWVAQRRDRFAALWAWLCVEGHSVLSLGVDDGWVDRELGSRVPPRAAVELLRRLCSYGATLSVRWVHRLANDPALWCAVTPEALPADGPLHLEDPSAFEVLAGAANPGDVEALCLLLAVVESRAAGDTPWRLPSSVADRLVGVYGRAAASWPVTAPPPWLVESVSPAGAVLLAAACDWGTPGWTTPRRCAPDMADLLERCELGVDAAAVLSASRDVGLVQRWVAGEFTANPPCAAAVAALCGDTPPAALIPLLAPHPQLWAELPQVAAAVVADDASCALLLAAPQCPAGLAAELLTRLGAPAPPTDPDPVLVAVRATPDADARLGPAVAEALMRCTDVPAELRVLLVTRSRVSAATWLSGEELERNPPVAGSFPDGLRATLDRIALGQDHTRSVLCAAAVSCESLPVDCRLEALAGCRPSDTSVGTQLIALLDAHHLAPAGVLGVVAYSPMVLGCWLAGGCSANPPTVELAAAATAAFDAAFEALDDGTRWRGVYGEGVLSAFARTASRRGVSVGRVAAAEVTAPWLCSLPIGALTGAAGVQVAAVVAELAVPHLGTDPATWRLFATLAADADMSVGELIAAVMACRGT